MTDSIPVVSQIKSIVQLLFGEKEQAVQTQVNFIDSTPVISQLKSAYQLYNGDIFDSYRTQKKFLIVTNATIDNIPIVGHIKGVGHYAIGHVEEGNNCMIDATRTTVVIISAYFVCLVAVPATASLTTTVTVSSIASAVGGMAMDALVYAFDTFFKEESKIQARFNKFKQVFREKDEEYDVGEYFDMIVGPILDGLMGAAVGYKMYQYRNGLLPSITDQVATVTVNENATISSLPAAPHKMAVSASSMGVNPAIPLPKPWNPLQMVGKLKLIKQEAMRYGTVAATIQRHADKELDGLFDDD